MGGTGNAISSAAGFLGLEVDPRSGLTWRMPVTDNLLNSAGTLWGGVGLSAFVAAAERAVERRCVWATVQYLAPIRAGARLRMDIEISGQGIALTQASGRGTVDGEPALLAIGTFGGDGPNDMQFTEAPDIPRPEECQVRSMPRPWGGGMLEQIEQRTLPGMALPHPDGHRGSGRTMLWMRLRDGDRDVANDVGALAVLADLAPSGISEAIGRATFGTSLDNSIRAARMPPEGGSGWVLMDITVEAVVGRVAQLSARMFDDGGRLLAVAGQSARLRRPRPTSATASRRAGRT
jgi:acyl-CoA thioesterase